VRPTAKSLILDLLATLREGSMPVRALVAAGALFDLDANNVRVALARLLAGGLVERDERGRYRAGARAGAIGRRIARWRSVEDGVRAWDGGWVAALGVTGRDVLRRAARGVRFFALRELAPGVHVRPDNVAGGLDAVREQLHALGVPDSVLVARLGDLDAATNARAVALWDVDALRASYRETRTRLAASAKRLPRLAPARAMVESFVLGGSAIRQIVLDPLLPEPLVPGAERAALVAAMRDYDRVGRACWAAFMRQFDVLPERRAPADVRIVEEAVNA
jgi:phenylacetic acid degradation operon negative regulatory protein